VETLPKPRRRGNGHRGYSRHQFGVDLTFGINNLFVIGKLG
jgi:hypothetical protein